MGSDCFRKATIFPSSVLSSPSFSLSSCYFFPVIVSILVLFRTAMLDELDFRKEAKNIADFTEFLDRADITDAVAPRVCGVIDR